MALNSSNVSVFNSINDGCIWDMRSRTIVKSIVGRINLPTYDMHSNFMIYAMYMHIVYELYMNHILLNYILNHICLNYILFY